MNSISPECQKLKDEYDQCFNGWFKDTFLRGGTRDTCKPLFLAYQTCVKNAIKEKKIDLWEVEKDILGTDQEKKSPKT